MVLAMACIAEGKSPFEIMRTYHIVEGKLSKKALAQLAEFRAKGGKVKWIQSGDDPATDEKDRKAIGEFSFEGNTARYVYSLADARIEGILRPNSRWTKRPGNMLRARCITNALGMLCPEIVAGEDNDGDAAMDIAPPAALDLSKEGEKAIEVKALPPKPAAIKEDEKELAAAGLAPAQAAAKSEPAKFIAAADANGLTAETLATFAKAIGDKNLKAVVVWLLNAAWIKPLENGEGDLSTLSLKRARQIIDNPAGFLAHAKIQ